jgi:hypothetical protein
MSDVLTGDKSDPGLSELLVSVAEANVPAAKRETAEHDFSTAFTDRWNDYIDKRRDAVSVALQDYFGYEHIGDLLNTENSASRLSVSIDVSNQSTQLLTLNLPAGDSNCSVELPMPRVALPVSELIATLRSEQISKMLDDKVLREMLVEIVFSQPFGPAWTAVLEGAGFPHQSAYYLPSARSGILQGWQIFASMALQLLQRRVGLERLEVPQLPGVAGDFLQILLERLLTNRSGQQDGKMKPALDLLEEQVFRGRISFETSRPELPLILYKAGAVEVPLQRASSMIAELAPLDLWLKYLLEPGDLLIIDEPEAHLHPENQRMIARVLVRLIRSGVKVLIPTHSSLILHQISNQILASSLSVEAREKYNFDFTQDDLISSDEVGVYLFDVRSDGTYIEPVPIEPEAGISEEEFIRVAESIGEETYQLELAALEGE